MAAIAMLDTRAMDFLLVLHASQASTKTWGEIKHGLRHSPVQVDAHAPLQQMADLGRSQMVRIDTMQTKSVHGWYLQIRSGPTFSSNSYRLIQSLLLTPSLSRDATLLIATQMVLISLRYFQALTARRSR